MIIIDYIEEDILHLIAEGWLKYWWLFIERLWYTVLVGWLENKATMPEKFIDIWTCIFLDSNGTWIVYIDRHWLFLLSTSYISKDILDYYSGFYDALGAARRWLQLIDEQSH